MRITDVSKLRGPLGELNGQLFGENGEERLAELNLWLKRVEAGLLMPVAVVTIPAIRRFSVAEVLGRTGVNRDGVRIAFLGDNFLAQFGSVVEENIPEIELVVSRLEHFADAIEIAGAIPREKRAVRISQIYALVRGQELLTGKGSLLTNGWANLFLFQRKDGNLWLVDVDRSSDGWYFLASPLDDPHRWDDESQVFSSK